MTKRTVNLIRIVDDNEEYRSSEAFMLRMFGYNVAEYESPLEFLEEDDPQIPGCVILDVKMPEMSGLELQQVMTEQSIGLPIIFLTGHGDVDMAVGALHQGASDFFTKPVEPERLKGAIERVLSQSQEKRRRQESAMEAKERFESLTPREKEVCLGVAKGLLNKEIAFNLGISEHTVKVHRASVKYKLQVNTPVEFVTLLKDAQVI